MKKEMPALMFLVGVGLLVFFVYAVFSVGSHLGETVASNRGTISSLSETALRFVGDNKIVLAIAAAVLILLKLLTSNPGPARS